MKIRLTKSEMAYYRTLRSTKAKLDAAMLTMELITPEQAGEYEAICSRVRTIRQKGGFVARFAERDLLSTEETTTVKETLRHGKAVGRPTG